MLYNRQNYVMIYSEEDFILIRMTVVVIQCIYNIPKLGDFRNLSLHPCLIVFQCAFEIKNVHYY